MINILKIDENNIIHFKFNEDTDKATIRVKCDNHNNAAVTSSYNNAKSHVQWYITVSHKLIPYMINPYLELEYKGVKYKQHFKFNSMDLKGYSLISNSCLGWEVYQQLNSQFNSPLIGNLILNDEKYVRMCEHIESYLDAEMLFGDIRPNKNFWNIAGSNRAVNNNIKPPHNYPVSHHLDIDIHWIHDRKRVLEIKNNHTFIFHESNESELVTIEEIKNAWNRRVKRCKGTKKICLWSASEMYNLHGNWKRNNLIERFKNLPHPSIFLTERKEEEYEDDLHIIKYIPEWEHNSQLEIHNSGGLTWNSKFLPASYIKDILVQKFL